MRIEFGEGAKGHAEVESLLRIIRRLRTTPESDHLREELERSAFDHLTGSEAEMARIRDLTAAQNPSWPVRAADLWQRFWGPSSHEMALSKQRSDALERADRAERSSFEALADMARVGRERDEANKEIEILRRRLDQLENAKRE